MPLHVTVLAPGNDSSDPDGPLAYLTTVKQNKKVDLTPLVTAESAMSSEFVIPARTVQKQCKDLAAAMNRPASQKDLLRWAEEQGLENAQQIQKCAREADKRSPVGGKRAPPARCQESAAETYRNLKTQAERMSRHYELLPGVQAWPCGGKATLWQHFS